jgi:hypothetical protein
VDNLEPVALVNSRSGPLATRYDRAILLDGYPVSFQTERRHKIRNRRRAGKRREITALAVNHDMHELNLPAEAAFIGHREGRRSETTQAKEGISA